MRRVLFVAYYYPPLGGGGVQRAVKFVRYLPEFGYEPVVLTGPGHAVDRWAPRDATLDDEVDRVEIHRVPGPEPELSRGWRRRAERVLDLESPFARWWGDGIVRKAVELAPTVDVILGELVPYVTGEPVAQAAAELELPWVADLQDPWALDEMWLYPTGLHRYRDLRRMRHVLGAADAIVMNTPEAAARVARRFPELVPRLAPAIPNGYDAADFSDVRPARASEGTFRIVHSGYLYAEDGLRHRRTRRVRDLLGGSPVRGVDFLPRSHVYLLEAVDRVVARAPELRTAIEVHLVGAASDTDRALAERSPVTRVHGYLPHRDSIELLLSADLLFLPMQAMPRGVRAGLVPGKTYEYLATGRPILAAVPEGDARDLLREAGNALVCDPTDVAAMGELIAGEIARWRDGRPPAYQDAEVVVRYERRRQTEALARVLDGATTAGNRAGARSDPPAAARIDAG
jgi:glycosyltransferase involved in cell wall biosynthesis